MKTLKRKREIGSPQSDNGTGARGLDRSCAVFSEASQGVKSGTIFILENASLKEGIVRKKLKILSSAKHTNFLLRQGKNLDDYHPEIVYNAVKVILDSPLNRLGMVGAVYVKTDSGILFEIKPHVRIPRTCERFCGIILELFKKSCIRDKDTGEVLLQVLDGPVTRHLPDNACIIGLSHSSPKLVDLNNYVSAADDNSSLVFVVGTMLHGDVGKFGTTDYISVSHYPLTTRCCVGLICETLFHKWKLF